MSSMSNLLAGDVKVSDVFVCFNVIQVCDGIHIAVSCCAWWLCFASMGYRCWQCGKQILASMKKN